MISKFTPSALITAAAIFTGLLVLALVVTAVRQPWLGLSLDVAETSGAIRVAAVHPLGPSARLEPGLVLQGLEDENGARTMLKPFDLVEEPDVAETYADMKAFFARQSALTSLLRQPKLFLIFADHEKVEIAPQAMRPLDANPLVAWVLIFVGATGFLIGVWVWSFKPDRAAGRFFALAGAGLMVSAFAASVYSGRELALDGRLFRLLSAANHFGALSFGAAMIGLFLSYPTRLVPARVIAAVPVVFGVWWAVGELYVGFSSPHEGHHLPTLLAMIGIVGAVVWQFFNTKGDPAARAALRWFGLSVTVGAGTFVLLVIVPNIVGVMPVLSQGYGFLLFLLVYGGAALGVARYRLFELEAYAFRILFYLCGVILLVLVDAALIYIVALDRIPAFGLSLFLIALFYLPLRDWLSRLFLGQAEDADNHLFRRVIDVALAPSGEEQNAAWRALLRDAFDPLRIGPNTAPAGAARIVDEGVGLAIPAVGALKSLRLDHARQGRKLFSPRDLRLAEEICAMLDHACASRNAYERGATEERARVARDMHDNIGAQLLSALHSKAPDRKDALIRETITDIRDIVNNAAHGDLSLDDALAELRLEASQRLELAGIELDWTSEAAEAASPISPHFVHALRSILREAVSNVIRHSGASRVAVSAACAQGRLMLSVADNGRGLDETAAQGNGLANMRSRAAALKGALAFSDNAPGLRLTVDAPLKPGTAP